jgi:hypothetical protein
MKGGGKSIEASKGNLLLNDHRVNFGSSGLLKIKI